MKLASDGRRKKNIADNVYSDPEPCNADFKHDKDVGLLSYISWLMLFAPLASVYLALTAALIIAVIIDRCGR